MENIAGTVKISIEDFESLRKKELELSELKSSLKDQLADAKRDILGVIIAFQKEKPHNGVYIHPSDLSDRIIGRLDSITPKQ